LAVLGMLRKPVQRVKKRVGKTGGLGDGSNTCKVKDPEKRKIQNWGRGLGQSKRKTIMS